MRWFAWRLALWTSAIVLLAIAGFGSMLLATLTRPDGTVRLAGPQAAIEMGRDAFGIVTIGADSEYDAAFALGYAHAQDRLFQMDLTRRLGAGRLSEVLGAATLRTDRLMRLLGLHRF